MRHRSRRIQTYLYGSTNSVAGAARWQASWAVPEHRLFPKWRQDFILLNERPTVATGFYLVE
jgi:hypothetical protein